jgi:nicotinamidase-related amidase
MVDLGLKTCQGSPKYRKREVHTAMLLDARHAVLFIVDIQARLAPAIDGAEAVIARTRILLTAADRLGVPVLVSEQYPQGLGHTDERLLPLPGGAVVVPKTAFSAADEPAIRDLLFSTGRRQIVLAGMETHVCVLQTALGLKTAGYEVAVAADAVGSRLPERRQLGLERMRAHGVDIVDSEMVVFEWLGDAAAPHFRELSKLIR